MFSLPNPQLVTRNGFFIPEFAVGIVARRRKPQRNAQLERFCNDGIFINMLRSKIVKQALQQGFSSRSRWLLQNLLPKIDYQKIAYIINVS